jgi:hypothetical protein
VFFVARAANGGEAFTDLLGDDYFTLWQFMFYRFEFER